MDNTYFEELKTSLEEANAYVRGDAGRVRVTVREIPLPAYTPVRIARLRKHAGLSQKALATAMGVSARTVEAWEAGKNKPSGACTKMLYLIEKEPAILEKLIAIIG